MSSLENKSSTPVVYLSGFKQSSWQKWHSPATPKAELVQIIMHFDEVRVVNRYAFVSRYNMIDKKGEPLEIQLPISQIKAGRKFLSRGRTYYNGNFSVFGQSIDRVSCFLR